MNDRISKLADVAAEAGDLSMVAVCRIALDRDWGDVDLDDDERAELADLTDVEARDRCVEALNLIPCAICSASGVETYTDDVIALDGRDGWLEIERDMVRDGLRARRVFACPDCAREMSDAE